MATVDAIHERLSTICLGYPESSEHVAWGHPHWKAGKKMFAAFGEEDEGGGLSLGVKVPAGMQDEYLKDPRFYFPAYSGIHGWVSMRLKGKLDWKEIAGLIDQSYREVALKRMLKALDER